MRKSEDGGANAENADAERRHDDDLEVVEIDGLQRADSAHSDSEDLEKLDKNIPWSHELSE